MIYAIIPNKIIYFVSFCLNISVRNNPKWTYLYDLLDRSQMCAVWKGAYSKASPTRQHYFLHYISSCYRRLDQIIERIVTLSEVLWARCVPSEILLRCWGQDTPNPWSGFTSLFRLKNSLARGVAVVYDKSMFG